MFFLICSLLLLLILITINNNIAAIVIITGFACYVPLECHPSSSLWISAVSPYLLQMSSGFLLRVISSSRTFVDQNVLAGCGNLPLLFILVLCNLVQCSLINPLVLCWILSGRHKRIKAVGCWKAFALPLQLAPWEQPLMCWVPRGWSELPLLDKSTDLGRGALPACVLWNFRFLAPKMCLPSGGPLSSGAPADHQTVLEVQRSISLPQRVWRTGREGWCCFWASAPQVF